LAAHDSFFRPLADDHYLMMDRQICTNGTRPLLWLLVASLLGLAAEGAHAETLGAPREPARASNSTTSDVVPVAQVLSGTNVSITPCRPDPEACPPTGPHLAKSRLLRDYRDRISQVDDSRSPHAGDDLPSPVNAPPWWQEPVTHPLRGAAPGWSIDVQQLIVEALRYSPHVQAISDVPLAQETAIVAAEAEFDVSAFMESKFLKVSEPVGNLLTTGGPARFRDENWYYLGGIRQKAAGGGLWELSQRIGLQNNNSNFFIPNDQGTAKLALSFTQPLLRGAGKAYNSSIIVLAQIDAGIAWDQFSTELQQHLVRVADAYWRLYFQRAVYEQKRRHLVRAQGILKELESRREVDALQSQILLARAAVAARDAEQIRAEAEIRNAEANIRALVNAPHLRETSGAELVPIVAPHCQLVDISLRDSLWIALECRPEIDASIKQIWAASVRQNVACRDVLPVLNLVMETYVNGLQGEYDIGEALGDQFSVGEPSYTVGLQFDVPLGQRAARARHVQRQIQMRQLVSQFKNTVETLLAEVEVAAREVQTAYREVGSKQRSMMAAQEEVNYLEQRWLLLPGDDRAASFLLEDLLDAQDRLATEEFLFAEAQATYAVATMQQKRTTGTLLQYEQVSMQRVTRCGVPQLILHKPLAAESGEPVEASTQSTRAAPELFSVPPVQDSP
jgi:outer membrane protein TolC